MNDIQVSKPVLIAIVGAILIGGFMLLRGGGDDISEAPLPATAPAPAGATGGTGGTGTTGEVGKKISVAAKREQARKEARKKLVEEAKAAGIPTPVYSALQDGKAVLIYFWEPDARDDQRTNDSVSYVKKLRGDDIVVIREPISSISKYDGIAEVAEITQTPGIVVMYGGEAITTEGYIDGDALNTRIARLTGEEK
jgi:hypothetical protein